MRIILQRVSEASVSVDGKRVGEITQGVVLLVGFGNEDKAGVWDPLVDKILNLRIFPDEAGRFHHSLLETKGQLLLIPQFTLYGDTSGGRRPYFGTALAPEQASEFFEHTVQAFAASGLKVQRGIFGAHMMLSLTNDGPVTLSLEA